MDDKKSLSERDICTKYITPALDNAGWDIQKQIWEEVYFTKGKIIVQGKTVKRGEPKKADYKEEVKKSCTCSACPCQGKSEKRIHSTVDALLFVLHLRGNEVFQE